MHKPGVARSESFPSLVNCHCCPAVLLGAQLHSCTFCPAAGGAHAVGVGNGGAGLGPGPGAGGDGVLLATADTAKLSNAAGAYKVVPKATVPLVGSDGHPAPWQRLKTRQIENVNGGEVVE